MTAAELAEIEALAMKHPMGSHYLKERRDNQHAILRFAVEVRSSWAEINRLRSEVQALEIIRDCPAEAVHLMPMAADAALREK